MTALAWYHLFVVGLFLPGAAVVSKRRLARTPLPDRGKQYSRTIVTLAVTATLSIWVAWTNAIELFPARLPEWRGVVAGVTLLATAIAIMRPFWRKAVEDRVRILYLFMPGDSRERALWIAVSIAAGICEEITWRGVQPALVARVVGSPMAAVILTAGCFGMAHAIQRKRSILVIMLLALSFQLIVWLSGSLYVAMAVHAIYDIVAGLTYARLGRELGYAVDPAATA